VKFDWKGKNGASNMSNTHAEAIADHVPPELVFRFDYKAETRGLSDPYQALQTLGERGAPEFFYTPVYGGHWVARAHETVRRIFQDHEHFTTFPMVIPTIEGQPRKFAPLEIDPPDHNKYRQALGPLFTPGATIKLEGMIRASAIRLITGFKQAGHCDFVEDYASKLPTMAFLDLMGMPTDRVTDFVAWAHDMLSGTPEQQASAGQNIFTFIKQFVDEKIEHPGEDWTSRLVRAKSQTGEHTLDQDELLDTVFFLFLAGLDTVRNSLAHTWRFLAENPTIQRNMLEQPDRVADTVEEFFRMYAVVFSSRRVRHDMEFMGIKLKGGDAILLPTPLSNRDANVFIDPQNFEVGREVNPHLTFGAGVHRCIGSNLARAEMRISIEEWFRQIPNFKVLPGFQVESTSGATLGLQKLPLVWENDK
jgi:cytochrome P450